MAKYIDLTVTEIENTTADAIIVKSGAHRWVGSVFCPRSISYLQAHA